MLPINCMHFPVPGSPRCCVQPAIHCTLHAFAGLLRRSSIYLIRSCSESMTSYRFCCEARRDGQGMCTTPSSHCVWLRGRSGGGKTMGSTTFLSLTCPKGSCTKMHIKTHHNASKNACVLMNIYHAFSCALCYVQCQCCH